MDVVLATATVLAVTTAPLSVFHEPNNSVKCKTAQSEKITRAYGSLGTHFVTDFPLRVALLLSLSLFSLGLMEIVPNSWLIIFDNDIDFEPSSLLGSLMTLTGAYQILMWMEVLFFCFVFPSTAAIIGVLHVSTYWDARTGERSRNKFIQLACRLFYILYSSIMFVFQIVTVTTRFIFLRTFGRYLARRRPLPRTESLSRMGNIKKKNFANASRSFDQTSEPQNMRGWTDLMCFNTKNAFCICIGILLGVAYSYLVLHVLGYLVVPAATAEDSIFLKSIVSRLSAVGMLVSSALNGFGCVSLPYLCLSGLFLEDIDPESVRKAEVDLQYVVKAIEEKRIALADLKQNYRSVQSVSQDNFSTSFQNCCRPYPEEITREETVLRSVVKEIEFLETLDEEIRNDIEDMVRDQKSAVMASTLIGRIMARVGIFFSIILLVRVASAMLAITQNSGDNGRFSSERADPVTLGLMWLTGHNIVGEEQYDSLLQCTSLLLTGFLSVSQVRTFLRTMKALILRLRCSTKKNEWSQNIQSSDSFPIEYRNIPSIQGLYSNVFASLMGCYFLSCAMSIKKILPLEYRSAFSLSLHGFDFEFDKYITNFVFASSACASTLILLMLFGIRRQNSRRHTFVGRENVENVHSNV